MVTAHLWADWAAVFAFGWVAAMMPGPDTAMILRNCLVFSRRDGRFTAIGIATGMCVHATLALVGIGVLIAQSLLAFTIVKWVGAVYLIVIGLRSLRARRPPAADPDQPHRPASQGLGAGTAFRLGLLTNLLNPKAPLLFLAAFTQIVHPGTPLGAQAVFGFTIAATALGWYILLTTFLAQDAVRGRLAAGAHWVERVAGGVFIALGVRLAFTHAR
ncbi:MAG TPA: LysE family transporter [bacterium]|nr:LysE family transporter [bacterium]